MIRRIKLPFKVRRPILACGADLKGAFALASGREAFLVDGFGDLGDLGNFTKYERAVKKHRKSLGIKPRVIACDLHPDYASTRFAESLDACLRVQHHEAHIAAAIVDSDIEGAVIGVAFDGTGYGTDGNIWGGEFFVGSIAGGFRRAAHLEYVPMPGGEKAIKEPRRMAVSYLYCAYCHSRESGNLDAHFHRHDSSGRGGLNLPYSGVTKSDLRVILAMIDKKINSPLTSGAGRLFDAAGSLILGKPFASREAELPMRLEELAVGCFCSCHSRESGNLDACLHGHDINGSYKFDTRSENGNLIIDTPMIIKAVAKDVSKKIDKAVISRKFHNTMADVIVKTVLRLSKKFKIKQACLAGGVFQNNYLTSMAVEDLSSAGIKVFTCRDVSVNDSGIPIGQIAIACVRNRI